MCLASPLCNHTRERNQKALEAAILLRTPTHDMNYDEAGRSRAIARTVLVTANGARVSARDRWMLLLTTHGG
jgi:hypothetical protein